MTQNKHKFIIDLMPAKKIKLKITKAPSSKKLFRLLALASSSYILLTMLSPIEEALARYPELTVATTRLLQLAVIIPIISVWGILGYAALRTHEYAYSIRENDLEAKGWYRIAQGLTIMLVGFVTLTHFNLIMQLGYNLFPNSFNVIVANYFTIFFNFLAQERIFRGTLSLVFNEKLFKDVYSHYWKVILLTIVIAVGYSSFVFANDFRFTSNNPLIEPTYYLTDALLVSTVIFPTLLTWTVGFLSILNLSMYKKRVKGVLYKNALKNTYVGLLLVIALSIILQFTGQLREQFSQYGLEEILIYVFGIILFWASGFVFIGSGARKLRKIEEVV